MPVLSVPTTSPSLMAAVSLPSALPPLPSAPPSTSHTLASLKSPSRAKPSVETLLTALSPLNLPPSPKASLTPPPAFPSTPVMTLSRLSNLSSRPLDDLVLTLTLAASAVHSILPKLGTRTRSSFLGLTVSGPSSVSLLTTGNTTLSVSILLR